MKINISEEKAPFEKPKHIKPRILLHLIYFPVFIILIEAISYAFVRTGHYSRGAVGFNIFYATMPLLIPLTIIISYCHARSMQSRIYGMSASSIKKILLSISAFVCNVLVAVYGQLRVVGGLTAFRPIGYRSGISFAWDT